MYNNEKMLSVLKLLRVRRLKASRLAD